MAFVKEKFFDCPYCWQNISMIIEPAEGGQRYIEDCEVCCQPIEISYSVDEDQELTAFSAVSIEQ